jgi:hypothetical protein
MGFMIEVHSDKINHDLPRVLSHNPAQLPPTYSPKCELGDGFRSTAIIRNPET